MSMLEIRHRVAMRAVDRYEVIENFGPHETVWETSSLAAAEESIARRKAALLEMVANISPAAKRAVEDARHIDNLKAGRS